MGQEASRDQHLYKETLHLPYTSFPIRARAHERDPRMVARWREQGVFQRAMACNEGAEQFILHDGPPYANGDIHLGHAYNRVLKDIITKSRRMMGYHVPVVPGWDCHGLPIEQKVAAEYPHKDRVELKRACRAYADKWVNVQKDAFIRLGVFMDWERPYITMDPSYEAATLEAFARLIEGGYIVRKHKTVSWCPTCATALASAEIEYKERKDPSVYVSFALSEVDRARLFPACDGPVSLVIWTTTPWTIPLNRAVVLKPDTEYAVVRVGDQYCVVGAELVEKFQEAVEAAGEVVTTISSDCFAGLRVHHPLVEGATVPVIYDDSVGTDEGTACVHSAPGCGPIDYEIGVKHGLEIYSPVAADGTYTDEIRPKDLAGMSVADGQIWVIKALVARNALIAKRSLRHSYPHCWRCGSGLIFRATPQWFCEVTHKNARARAIQALDNITFYPSQGKNFLASTIENRWEWCLSRQRTWGVPIPALLDEQTGEPCLRADIVRNVAQKVADHGIEYWDETSLEQMQQNGVVPDDVSVSGYQKETDILDVWFDSGISHYAVVSQNERLSFPASLYLEGVDQHRGWFQSSLLTSIMMHDEPQTKGIMTHGFTVDAKGHKMSKSRGNTVLPSDIIDRIGTDGLRLWVARLGNEGDVVVSDEVIKNTGHVYRKIRNTCRFLLQNLHDYRHSEHAVEVDALSELDRYALYTLRKLNKEVVAYYRDMHITGGVHALVDYCTNEISAFYADIVKDRLYCGERNARGRRSAQTVLWYMLDTLTRLIAPIMSFLAEEVADYYQAEGHDSIHLQQFADHQAFHICEDATSRQAYDHLWDRIKTIRGHVLKALEEERAAGSIRHSLEARVVLTLLPQDAAWADCMMSSEFWKELCIVSDVVCTIGEDDGEVSVVVDHAPGVKCPRCWHWSESDHDNHLCDRCAAIVDR